MNTLSSNVRPRLVFIAAVPREISGLVRGWRVHEDSALKGIYVYSNDHAVIACAGMGVDRAAMAVEAAFALGPAAELISIGWAGACIHRLAVGEVVWPDVIVDVRTGERFFPHKQRTPNEGLEILVTVPNPASAEEKERLALSYYASAVDMEAAAVARLARANDLPFQAIKAISDDASFDVPDLSRFMTSHGQIREAAVGIHVATRPALWKKMLTLSKGSKLAVGRLQEAVRDHIQEHVRTQRTQTT